MSVTTTGGGLVPNDITAAMRLAEMMATSKLVPPHLQKSPGDCLLVIEQAMRWKMSPFAVAQCTSVIHQRLMFEGKLVAAAIHGSGILEGRLNYSFTGINDTREVRCYGTIRGEMEPRDISVKVIDARTTNDIWKKQPDQQLIYSSTRAWGRRHAPEVMLGVFSPEDFEAPKEIFRGTTLDAALVEPEEESEPLTPTEPPVEVRERRMMLWLDALDIEFRDACAMAEDRELIETILARDDVRRARDVFRGAPAARLAGLIARAEASVRAEAV